MTPFLESHFHVTLLTCLVARVGVPFRAAQLVRIIAYAKEAVVGVRFRYNATHAVAIAMGGWAVVMSVKGGVTPSADDPEWAIFLHVIWSCIVTFEAVWEGGAFVFGASDLAYL